MRFDKEKFERAMVLIEEGAALAALAFRQRSAYLPNMRTPKTNLGRQYLLIGAKFRIAQGKYDLIGSFNP